jgi:hypothetical protein
MRSVLLALLPLLVAPSAALAQKEIPKAPGFDQCPAGYVNTLGTTCVSPVYYEVAPTNGQACKAGWMNIGAGYCKKKKGPLGCFDPLPLPVRDEVGIHPAPLCAPR